jgi:hypothetical protein
MLEDNDPVLYLAQYWASAEHMRRLTVSVHPKASENRAAADQFRTYHSYWLSALYVVVEGYRALGLDKDKVPQLKNRARIDTLSEFRNGTFHYQRDHEKQIQFLGDESSRVSSMNWAALLHEEFRQYFVEVLEAREDWGLP